MKTIKKLGATITPMIRHVINVIIATKDYPTILKIQKITPNLKPDKPPQDTDSYRPINNCSTIDKLVQQYIKDSLTIFFYDNDILHDNHHGSRKYHSTNTALTQIYNQLQ